MDPIIYLENKKPMHLELKALSGNFTVQNDDQQEIREKYYTNSMECLIGTRDGTIYVYDPLLIAKANVFTYNGVDVPFHKPKRPEIVRWVEPILSSQKRVYQGYLNLLPLLKTGVFISFTKGIKIQIRRITRKLLFIKTWEENRKKS